MGSSSINWRSNLDLRELYYLRSRWNHLLTAMIRSGKQLSHPFSSGLWKPHAIMLSSCLCLSTLSIPRPIRVHYTWNLLSSNQATIHLSICRLWEPLTSCLHTPYTNLVFAVSSRTCLVLSLEQNLCEEGSLINTFDIFIVSHTMGLTQILLEWIKSM